MNNRIEKTKHILSIISFACALILGFIALFLPPQGVIDSSVLWFTSQLLVFVATMLGVNLSIDNFKKKVTNMKGDNTDE